jgi:hypothetical protein
MGDQNKKKKYQKPSWEKQEMYERFALACTKLYKNSGCESNKKTS